MLLRKLFFNYYFQILFLITASLAIFLALVTYNPMDPSLNVINDKEPSNILGYFGAYVSNILYSFLGISSYILPLSFGVWGLTIYKKEHLPYWSLKVVLLIFSIISLSFFSIQINLPFSYNDNATGLLLLPYYQQLSAQLFQHITRFAPIFANFEDYFQWLMDSIFSVIIVALFCCTVGINFAVLTKVLLVRAAIFLKKILEFKLSLSKKLYNIIKFLARWLQKKVTTIAIVPNISSRSLSGVFTVDHDIRNIEVNSNLINLSSNIQTPIVSKNDNKSSNTAVKNNINNSTSTDFCLPDINLLKKTDNQNIKADSKSELHQNATELLNVLGDFGVKGNMIEVRQGPVVTLYEFEPAAGTKSSRVIGLSEDIARSLSAISTRIAVVPGRNVLGIELPNKQRAFFALRELIETSEYKNPNIILPLILGKDIAGRPFIADLAKMPHLLIAGTTGSGKSVAINTMILSLLFRYTPADCRLIMIDPKMLELSVYDNIPHLLTPVVTEPSKAIVALKWAVREMENRYRLMSQVGVRNITGYNAKITEAINSGKVLERTLHTGFDQDTGEPVYDTIPLNMNKLPYIVVIVDEMADLMLVAGKDIEASIQRLAQMARAAGIHIIMATQRPSVDVITGVIKANFPSRISFKVTSKIDSRTILGEQGAEQLLGMGDMLYMGNSTITRVHGPFVDDIEVENVAAYLRSLGEPDYISSVTEDLEDDANNGTDDLTEISEENLYAKALKIVQTERKVSISYIQRCLRIGYNRAADIVDKMEKNGVVSPPGVNGKREILLPDRN